MTEMATVARGSGCGGVCGGFRCDSSENGATKERSLKVQESQLSILELIIAAFRKSMAACRVDDRIDESKSKFRQMEIGWPTDVQHLTHVTFDRFHGFLGLPVEFEVEIPSRVPSARVYDSGKGLKLVNGIYNKPTNWDPRTFDF